MAASRQALRKTTRCGPSWGALLKEMARLGPIGTVRKILKYNVIKVGKHIGTDEMGNKYDCRFVSSLRSPHDASALFRPQYAH